MNAALLCPGPSLALVTEADLTPYALRVGVNRAAVLLQCDWWVACDYTLIRDWHTAVLGNPALLTRRQTWADIGRRCPRFGRVWLVEDFEAPPVHRWDVKSATVALAAMAQLMAMSEVEKRIDVYGADWTDAPDYDGHTQPGTVRNAARWDEERATWEGMVEWLNGRGVEVYRLAR